MDQINPLITILIFVSGLALAESLLLVLTGRRQMSRLNSARNRLKRHANQIQRRASDDKASILLQAPDRGPILRYLTGLIPNRQPLDLWLYRAGSPMQLELFVGVSILFGILGFMLGNVVSGSPLIAAGFILSALLPFFWVRRKKNKRMADFEKEFPEALDLLCRSLKAGHPLSAALKVVADEIEEPVATEFAQVVDETRMGLEPRTALQNLAIRMNTSDMPFFVNAIVVQRETGGDLPRVLEGLANTTRQRSQFHTKVDAIVSQTKLSANALALIPPVFTILITTVAPEYAAPLYEPGPGKVLLPLAGILTFVGWALSRQLATVKV
jgi:tight adherence protein B